MLISTVKVIMEDTHKWWRLNEVMQYVEENLACGENSINVGNDNDEDDDDSWSVEQRRRGWRG